MFLIHKRGSDDKADIGEEQTRKLTDDAISVVQRCCGVDDASSVGSIMRSSGVDGLPGFSSSHAWGLVSWQFSSRIMQNVLIRHLTGVLTGTTSELVIECSRAGAICVTVIASLLIGYMLVFLNAWQTFDCVKPLRWAFVYMWRKTSLVTLSPVCCSHSSSVVGHAALTMAKMTTSSPWRMWVACGG
jgi:hypothetical protein